MMQKIERWTVIALVNMITLGCSQDSGPLGSEPPPKTSDVVEEKNSESHVPNEEILEEAMKSDAELSPQYLFQEETNALAKSAECRNMKTTPGSGGFGPLAGCIEGEAETAKLFVNGAAHTKEVKNIKVMWNDWFKDVGYGLHPDKAAAERLLRAVTNRYAPAKTEEIKKAFFQRRQLETEENNLKIVVSHTKGPAIDEHLLTISFLDS